ncbi:MAG TPA: TonB-dependent receptor [Bryobacteraceae bacterium]|nr:TonB-dependent receptor [Bryobacteraceae bacterium]
MIGRFGKSLFFVLLAIFLATVTFAQTQTARLVGTVHDSSGAVLPNAKVTAIDNATKLRTEVTTNSSGDFVFPVLQPGTYSLTVESSGFRKAMINDIELDAASNVSQSVTLEVGQMTETVEVTANTITVQTAESQIANSVTLTDIDTLPQLARTPITLAVFQPGVQIFPTANGSSSGADYSFAHVNGLRQGSNNNTLDGIDVNDSVAPRIGLSLTANNTDSVEEARVVTDGGKAEYGRNAGGQVQLVTKSGTNQFHGNAFDYLRNRDFNANDFFNNAATPKVPIPVLIQNNYGGSFGGPIKHNKLFFFGNYQGIRTHAQGIQNTLVPTATAEQGIFEWNAGTAASPNIKQYNILTADPLAKGIDPTVAALLKLYPAPNNNNCASSDGLNSSCYDFNYNNGSLSDQFTVKVDYNISDKMHVFERTSWQRNSSIDSLNGAQNVIPGQAAGTQGGKRWGVAGGWDWTISSTLVNQFRYGHQSASVNFNRPEREAGPMVSFNTWTTPILTAFPQGRNSPVDEYTDNLTKIRGNHTIKFGGQFRDTDQYGFNDAGIYPNISLSTANGNVPAQSVTPAGLTGAQTTTFQGLYNDLLGRISSVTETYYSNLTTFQAAGTPRVRNFLFHEYGFFAQDDWKITPRLTLNLGIRWEYFPVPNEENGFQGIMTPQSAFNTAGEIDNATIVRSNKWFNNDYHSFAPRFGFAWDPFGNGKTAIRGGYGIFYDRMIGAAASSVDGATPGFAQAVTIYPNSTTGSDVRIGNSPPLPQQPASPAVTPAATRQVALDLMAANLTNGYVQQWNLNIQRQIAKNTILDVGYVGNRGVKLFFQTNLDQSYIYNNGFLTAFNQIAAYVASANPVPAGNPIVAAFGSLSSAISGIGSSNFSQGQVGAAANTMDVNHYSAYANAGISEYYLRHFPQFSSVLIGNNDGRSEYNSLQARLTRQFGALRLSANFTWSKSIDNDLSAATGGEGNGFAAPLDSFNEALDRGRSNFDIPKAFTMNAEYTLPVGKGHLIGGNMPKWANAIFGGWDVGGIVIWESGTPFTVSSGRATGPSTAATWANYTGDRNIGAIATTNNGIGPGVYYFTPAQVANFSEPAAGFIGSSGRNAFRGPRFFNFDTSLVKRFEFMERKYITFRAEAYNTLNNVDFNNPTVNLNNAVSAFGKISSTVNNPRIMQLALRIDF